MSEIRESIVIGSGWSAVGACFLLRQQGKKVTWLHGSGAKVQDPLGLLDPKEKLECFWKVAKQLGFQKDQHSETAALREFRSKAFGVPEWNSEQEKNDRFHGVEKVLIPVRGIRCEWDLAEFEKAIRSKVLEDPEVETQDFAPVQNLKVGEVQLQSGESFSSPLIIYADRWVDLPTQGVSGEFLLAGKRRRFRDFNRKTKPCGLVQLEIVHRESLPFIEQAFLSSTPKEPGETFCRSIMGYFFDGGKKSIWTMFLQEDEGEDNHQISKRIRKIKNQLNKIFNIGTEGHSFLETISHERVRFEDAYFFSSGSSIKDLPKMEEKNQKVLFLTDGFGFSVSWSQLSCLEQSFRSEKKLGSARQEKPADLTP